jgi:anti-sigma B factor antagonist
MEFRVDHQDDVTIVAVVGSIDAMTAGEATEFMLDQVAAGHRHLVFNMVDVPYLSSAGLRTLVAVLKEARAENGDLRLAAIQPDVMKVLQMSGFVKILDHYDGVDEAVDSYQ